MLSTPEVVVVEMISYDEFRICCKGNWETIKAGEFGFIDLTKAFPVIKTIHSMICECRLREKP